MKKDVMSDAWDILHTSKRFLPRYPSEAVIRYVFRNYPEHGREKIRILDLGCGGGRHLLFLAREGFAAYGTDISEVGLSHTRKVAKDSGLRCIIKKSTMERQPFNDGFFDGVIAYGVLYYNDSEGYRRSVREIRRILKKGGKALIVTRTTVDYRAGKGKRLEKNTYTLSTDATNEKGMHMHFLDRRSIGQYFKDFSAVEIGRVDFTIGAVRNSDWIIEATK